MNSFQFKELNCSSVDHLRRYDDPVAERQEFIAHADSLVRGLADQLLALSAPDREIIGKATEVAPIPDVGLGIGAAPELWRQVSAGSTMLSCPGMIGHLNTAPHFVASLTDALVSQLNNNLIFEELSPFASRVEESLIGEFSERLGFKELASGTFCSGASIANLSALFAATGGFRSTVSRRDVMLFVGETAHSSIFKAAHILGIDPANIVVIDTDTGGHMDVLALRESLRLRAKRNSIVVATLGTTLQGAVDDIPQIAKACNEYEAWLHVDAALGGNLAFSQRNRRCLVGLNEADSISIAPQKWLWVPRLSALVLLRRRDSFRVNLDWPMPYSTSSDEHRGRWGIQASRRADAVTLWVFLQVVGSERVGGWIDSRIALAKRLFELLKEHPRAVPAHEPDLALQLFRVGDGHDAGRSARKLQRELADTGNTWVSLAHWRGETLLRIALLNRATQEDHLVELLNAV